MRQSFVVAAILLTIWGCKADSVTIPDSQSDTATGDVTNDVAPDAEPDTPPDTAPDTVPDTTEDTSIPDATPDTAPDATEDTSTTDTHADTSEDAADTSPDPGVCDDANDCTWCVFSSAPVTVDDCTCPLCPTTAMPRAQCEANNAAWDTICGGANWHDSAMCPIPRCIAMPELTCSGGTCLACDTDACPVLTCKLSDQSTAPGDCCPKCTGTNSCSNDEDCGLCLYSRTVSDADDCYCPLCPTHAVSNAQCELNSASWTTHCAAWYETHPCPVAICLPTAASICNDGGQCMRNPNTCFSGDDCTTCRFAEAPRAPSQCACPGCPRPTSVTHCEAIEAAVDNNCYDFDFDSCELPVCARPPALGCRSDYTCGYGDLMFEPE